MQYENFAREICDAFLSPEQKSIKTGLAQILPKKFRADDYDYSKVQAMTLPEFPEIKFEPLVECEKFVCMVRYTFHQIGGGYWIHFGCGGDYTDHQYYVFLTNFGNVHIISARNDVTEVQCAYYICKHYDVWLPLDCIQLLRSVARNQNTSVTRQNTKIFPLHKWIVNGTVMAQEPPETIFDNPLSIIRDIARGSPCVDSIIVEYNQLRKAKIEFEKEKERFNATKKWFEVYTSVEHERNTLIASKCGEVQSKIFEYLQVMELCSAKK